jgi:uncharacterized protein YdcH (DUF465 family)
MPERHMTDPLHGMAGEEYERLALKHQKCEQRLTELRGRLILSDQEKVEEVNLKKQKLQLKDRMEAIAREILEASASKSG